MSSSKKTKLYSLKSLLRELARRRAKRVVFTNGCFDILHAGHVRYLREAKSLGDILVVGLNTDSSVRGLGKAPGRPYHSQKDRAEVIGGLESVDYVTFFSEATPEKLIRAVKPDTLVKGGDWKAKDMAGGPFVLSYGGKVRSLGFSKGLSTTRLILKIRRDARA